MREMGKVKLNALPHSGTLESGNVLQAEAFAYFDHVVQELATGLKANWKILVKKDNKINKLRLNHQLE